LKQTVFEGVVKTNGTTGIIGMVIKDKPIAIYSEIGAKPGFFISFDNAEIYADGMLRGKHCVYINCGGNRPI